MILADIPQQSKIRVQLTKDGSNHYEDVITFHHLDGMYSYCETSDGKVVHLSRMAPLKLGDDGIYELDTP